MKLETTTELFQVMTPEQQETLVHLCKNATWRKIKILPNSFDLGEGWLYVIFDDGKFVCGIAPEGDAHS